MITKLQNPCSAHKTLAWLLRSSTDMMLPSTLFCLLNLVFGHLVLADQTSSNLRNGESLEGNRNQARQQRSLSSQRKHQCQEGIPLGESYSGRVNVTASGRTCQVWAASQPHDHSFTEVGEHNHCRNPNGNPGGVWCYTTDPDKPWELCSVPHCDVTYNCQEGDPLGVSYSGNMSTTAS